MKRNFRFKRLLTLVLAVMMLVTAMPVGLLAETDYNYDKLQKNKSDIINQDKLPVLPAKTDNAADLIKNPAQPAIYTYRTEYKVQRGEKYEVDYQPYIASVGEAATDDEKAKVKKEIFLPDLAGYDKSQLDESYTIDYDTVTKNQYQDFKYKAKSNTITIKHIFQTMEDFTKYTNPNGTITHFDGVDPNTNKKTGTIIKKDGSKLINQSEDEIYKNEKITTQNGNTGSTMEVSPLQESDPDRKGYIPEAPSIMMQVPEDANDFVLEYRYNLAHYDVVFDTKGGTPVPSRTLYYEQVIPKLDENSIPTKEGGDFLGWMPSITLETTGGKTFAANKIIEDNKGNAIIDLHNTIYEKDPNGNFVRDNEGKLKAKKSTETIDLKMPAQKITFIAVWKDKPKADYAIQFWAEKADHADNASIMDKYEYMGTRVYKDADTGFKPDLDAEHVRGLKFPDLDQARLNKIWANARFNRGHDLYLNKFFVYNQALTHDQNKDPANVNLVKSVDATGKTVYNIYYDRQVYDLYFTKSNALPEENTFYPEIWGYDEAKGEAVMKGGPGNLYHYKARFNEMMYKWPNDAKQTKGFTPGYQSFGWGPNYGDPNWPIHLDTPPYRLNADEFLDMANYTNWKGYTKKIDKGDGQTMDLDRFDFTTLSFGIKQDKPSIPHHMDFWMDGFKDGETIIRYDLVRTKADTANLDYGHRYPRVQGFTPHGYDPTDPQSGWPVIEEGSEKNGRVNEDDIDDLNDERDEITPNNCGTYYNNNGIKLPIGQLDFISVFFSDSDDFGEPITDEDGVAIVPEFKENGYLRYKYKRNKYPLRFNYDPSIIRDDSYFNSNNQLDTFYEFPLKVLSPDLVDSNLDREDREYFKEDPKNLLDNPENLQKLGLSDLVFTDTDGKLKVKRPDNLSDQMVFKGWALDPAGTKLIWENPKETMPTHPLNLYAKWGEPDYKWKVTFDPDGGTLRTIREDKLTTERKKIQEGDIGQEEVNTYAKKGYLKEGPTTPDGKQIFTVIQRQKLVEPRIKPVKKGYDFMGWEVIRYKKDPTTGDYTDKIDDSYRKTYKVPELYTFGNDVVSPLYLKAIWVPNNRVDVKVEHYILDDNFKLDTSVKHNPQEITLENKRSGYLVATTGDKQDDKYILATHEELEAHKDTSDTYNIYKEYNDRVKLNNTFFQTFRVEPAEIPDPNDPDKMIDNPNLKNNVFKFFYRPYRQRKYKVNYIDERFKGKETEEGAAIIDQELVTNGNRHYDARNYRVIPGWVLTSAPQQQLFFDVNEDTNEFLGINGTGKDEITFYYKDVRVIEVPNKDDPVPDGYVRVTFKADKGGAFTDKDGNSKTELYYDVIKGLKSDLLPVPKELEEGKEKEADKYYITPDNGKKFVKWDNSALLNKNTIINEAHTFTAYFEWSGLTASGLVRTEAYKDPNGKWTNDFAPKIEDLKKQLVWREKDEVKPLPEGTEIKLFDEKGNELTSNDQVYELVTEKKAADKDELVRTVNVKAKVTFPDKKDPQELTIPITVYKNVYEALNKDGDKPLFLKEAEGKKAEKGGLSDVTGDYVMVTVQPTEKNTNKDAKVYYVNPKAWVNIPEVEWSEADKDKYDFLKWTADKFKQNEDGKENGIFDFSKRHKFTDKETLIKPLFTDDVVEQKEGEDKPKVPDTFVKVIVKITDKATTESTQTFWVNPTKEVTIPVANPTGKSDQEVEITGLGKKKVNYVFNEWQKVKTGETDDSLTKVDPAETIDLASHKYTAKVTVIEAAYKKAIQAEPIVEPLKTTKLDTPQGKKIEDKDLIEKITPQEGKEIDSITVIENPDTSEPGSKEAKVIVKYKDGTTQGTDKDPVKIPVEVHKNIIPEVIPGQKPEGAMDNYVKVIFKAEKGGTLSGDLVYYVSPEVEVDMTESAGKITKTPEVGYISGDWDTSETKKLKGTFTDAETEFVFNFDKSKDIVEKTDDPNQVIPKGYVKVTFKTEAEAKGKLEGDKAIKIYYVNPKAEIKLVELADGKTATDKQLAVPKTAPAANYEFETWYEEIDQTTAITSERIHVAKFRLAKVTLTYDAGGADGTVPEKLEVDHGTKVRLARPDGLSKENATFAGWKIGETTYQAGDEITLNENTTATAQWTATKHTVTFNSKGGSDVASQTVEHGNTATEPKAPRLDGKVFMGWKEKESDTNYFDFANTAITEDKTLIAIWEKPVQKIKENDPVEEQFIKVTFKEGDHGTLKGDTVFKVAKNLSFDQAVQAGLEVPEIIADKYYKAKEENDGWDKALDLTLEANETEKVFTAQYEPEADVIPVDPAVTDEEQIKEEKPEGMVLVEFVVDETKAFMLGDTKFYVKVNTKVDIPTPVVHPRTLENDEPNDYEFKGWSYEKDEDGNYNFIFTEDKEINDGNLVKPIIYLRNPRPNARIVYVTEITEGATAYIEVTRGSNPPVVIEAINEDGFILFKIPAALGGKLNRRDRIRAYSILNNVQSDIREYRVR